MFDIGFGEIVVVLVIGLIVLGPERLPVAVKTVTGWLRAMRSLATSVQNELTQELKLQELKEGLKKAESAGLQNLSPELKASMDELKEIASGMKNTIQSDLNKVVETPVQPLVPTAVSTPVSETTMAAEVSETEHKPAFVESTSTPVADEVTAKPTPVSTHKSDSET
ncbi:Sec-independent protein translocase protein TatB [Budvicia diplopodorum]|uniref:Sec-independent protein translocase protein TatB n=1 Tax=Budvicia diplopodorum TaxID=1119056 RepID=UPI00135A3BA9|nr:Sec-independent protein translocase protein TatB [Budvicia diplopodorum]